MTWSACAWVNRIASTCSMCARSACCRKSGVVSIRILWPLKPTRTEGRRRLSRGSLDVHTSQWQPTVGTPELVPEPSTVILNGLVLLFSKMQQAEMDLRLRAQRKDQKLKRGWG